MGIKFWRTLKEEICSIPLLLISLLAFPILFSLIYHPSIAFIVIATFLILILELFIIAIFGCFLFQIYLNKIAIPNYEYINRIYEGEYSAVLIGNNLSWCKNFTTNVCACGLYCLIEYFKNANNDYVVCQKINISDFNKFVLDGKCQELYLVGHGSKGSFRINKKTDENDGIVYYSKYKEAPPKKVIAQLHCANTIDEENNESLMYLLAIDDKKSYVGCGAIYFPNIWRYCFKMWIKNRPKK